MNRCAPGPKCRNSPSQIERANFREVELGYPEEAGKEEAGRCLNCGYCCECFQCVEACKAGAVTLETHAQKPETLSINVGSVILAPDFRPLTPPAMTPIPTPPAPT